MKLTENDINDWIKNGDPINATTLNKHVKELINKLGQLQPEDIISENLLNDDQVSRNKIKNNQVNADKIQDSSISTSKIFNNSITNDKIAQSAITENKIQNNQVSNSKISDDSITENKIQNNQVSNSKIQNNAITLDKFQNINSGVVIGRLTVGDGEVEAIPTDTLKTLFGLGEGQDLGVGTEDGQLMTVPSFGIGQDEKISVLKKEFDDLTPPPSDKPYNYIYGNFQQLKGGIYQVDQNHEQNIFQEDQTLIVQKNKDSFNNLLLQNNNSNKISIQGQHENDSTIDWKQIGIIGAEQDNVLSVSDVNNLFNNIDYTQALTDLGTSIFYDIGEDYGEIFQIPLFGIGYKLNETTNNPDIFINKEIYSPDDDLYRDLNELRSGIIQVQSTHDENILTQNQTALITQYSSDKRQLLFLGVETPQLSIQTYDENTKTYDSKNIQIVGSGDDEILLNSENEIKFFSNQNIVSSYGQSSQGKIFDQPTVYQEIENIKSDYFETQNIVSSWQNQPTQNHGQVLSQDVVYQKLNDVLTRLDTIENKITNIEAQLDDLANP